MYPKNRHGTQYASSVFPPVRTGVPENSSALGILKLRACFTVNPKHYCVCPSLESHTEPCELVCEPFAELACLDVWTRLPRLAVGVGLAQASSWGQRVPGWACISYRHTAHHTAQIHIKKDTKRFFSVAIECPRPCTWYAYALFASPSLLCNPPFSVFVAAPRFTQVATG